LFKYLNIGGILMPKPVSNESIYMYVYSMHCTCNISIKNMLREMYAINSLSEKILYNFIYVLFFYSVLKFAQIFMLLVVIFVLAEVFVDL